MVETGLEDPPRNGEGDRAAQRRGGGGPDVLTAPIKTVKKARKLRRQMTLPEVLLWKELRQGLGGFKFRRQHPQDSYILDFACLEARLGIEIDGEVHSMGDRPERDAKRDLRLGELGFTMLRIPAIEVLQNLEDVTLGIIARCETSGPLHQPAAGPPPRPGEDLS